MRMMTDDDELAMKAGAGDAQAFRLLLERHYDRIYRLAYRFFGNRADAEDIAQDVCAALPKKLKSFAARARFTTWIYQVVVNTCRDQLRSQTSCAALIKDYVEVNELISQGDRDTKAQVEWLYAALESLSPQLRETAILVLAEEMTHREAGEVLGIKEATVSWRMHEMRKKLKVLAEASDGDNL
jgi:RNA polymerase sigma-70 factor (ECF subfamily)